MNIFGRKNNVITYTINKAKNNDLYITIQNGEVVVNAPWYFSSNKIQTLVEEKKNWIINKIKEYEQTMTNIQSVKIFGKKYDVKVLYKNIKTPELNIESNFKINVILPNKYNKIKSEEILKIAIQKMYEQIAKAEIDNLMEKIRIMLGIAPDEYKLEKMENTLGKCIENTIIINPELMQYKKEIIEYVIAHEFCHLKYKTHGKKFVELIEKYFKEYKSYEKEIIKYKI